MLEEKITEVVDKLVLLSEQFAAPAFQTMLNAVQIESIWFLVIGGGLAALLPMFYTATKKMIRATQATDAQDNKDATAILQAVLAVMLGIATITAAISATRILFNVGNWIGAFDPATEIARRIIE